MTDNFAGAALRTSDPRFSDDTGLLISDTETFNHGLQAFWEYHAVRNLRYGHTGDYTTADRRENYRFNTYGSNAATFVLDARSFRSEELPPVSDPNVVPLGGGDRYEGYAAEGTELLKYIDDSQSPTSSLSRPTFTARW